MFWSNGVVVPADKEYVYISYIEVWNSYKNIKRELSVSFASTWYIITDMLICVYVRAK